MTEEKKEGVSHSKFDKVWEFLQTSGVIGAILLGARQPPKQGEALPGGKEVPGWLMSAFPSFTREDETEFNLILDSHPDPNAKLVESTFRNNFITEGYDETKYRLGLVHFRREYLERMRSPMPEDKSGGRLTFAPLSLKDSANEFLTELIAGNSTGGSPEEIFERQEKIALNRKLLEKTGALKNMLSWARENKFETLILIALCPLVIASLFYWILNFIFG